MTSVYGESQIIRTPDTATSLTLETCDFLSSDSLSLGYSKLPNESQTYSVEFNFFGTPIVSKGRYFQKKKFKWELSLTMDKMLTLKALYDEQKSLVQNYQLELTSNTPTYEDFYLELIDGRIPDIDKDTLTRSYDSYTAFTGTLPASPVAGYSVRWYRYLINITKIEGLDQLFLNDRGLTKVMLEAEELDIATVANFPVTDLLT